MLCYTGQNRAMTRNKYLFHEGFFLPFDTNLFTYNCCILPLTLKLVLMWVVWIDLLNIQVLHIGNGICDAPCDVLIVSNDNTGGTGKTCTNYVDIARDKMTFIPDRGSGLSKMWIIAEDRSTCRCHRAIHDPVIASTKHPKAA